MKWRLGGRVSRISAIASPNSWPYTMATGSESCTWYRISSGCRRALIGTTHKPALKDASIVSRNCRQFHWRMATRSPFCNPSDFSASANACTRSSSSAYVARDFPHATASRSGTCSAARVRYVPMFNAAVFDMRRQSTRKKLEMTHTSNTVCHTMTCVGSRVWVVPGRAPIPAIQWSRRIRMAGERRGSKMIANTAEVNEAATRMTYLRIYVDADGATHFDDHRVAMTAGVYVPGIPLVDSAAPLSV